MNSLWLAEEPTVETSPALRRRPILKASALSSPEGKSTPATEQNALTHHED
jgi:hypothetical protein